jgi:hypothetical protein
MTPGPREITAIAQKCSSQRADPELLVDKRRLGLGFPAGTRVGFAKATLLIRDTGGALAELAGVSAESH